MFFLFPSMPFLNLNNSGLSKHINLVQLSDFNYSTMLKSKSLKYFLSVSLQLRKVMFVLLSGPLIPPSSWYASTWKYLSASMKSDPEKLNPKAENAFVSSKIAEIQTFEVL